MLLTSVAAADVREPGRAYVAGILAYKGDGSVGPGGDNSNPLTNSLTYTLFGIEGGYIRSDRVGGHISATAGPLSGDETSGTIFELLAGPDLQTCLPRRPVCLGIRLDAGYARAAYGETGALRTSFHALLIEPKVWLGVTWGQKRLWQLRLLPGMRLKWIFQDDMRGPQRGISLSMAVVRQF